MARNPATDALLGFIDASPTPYHAVEAARARLLALGARELREDATWTLLPGETAFLTRGGGSILAFRLPPKPEAQPTLPFHIVGAHTDSPCLKLKPRPAEGPGSYQQWGVEVYGGALYNSWLDRDLLVAGRVSRCGEDGLQTRLVRLDGTRFRIPQLAIHLDRGVNEQGLQLNPQKHLVPVLGLQGAGLRTLQDTLRAAAGHNAQDMDTLSNFEDTAFDLFLSDSLPAAYGGLNDEFIYAPRLDNLAMSHAALEAFCGAPAAQGLIQVMALFDHEEVGSASAQGAASDLLATVLERIHLALGLGREAFLASKARSFLVSADMAHALHPNYPEKHDAQHFPLLNKGPVLKGNAGLRYATLSEGAARFRHWCHKAEVPLQNFINRTDLACGSTIGPILSTRLGIEAVDVGNPMLSMHSAREMAGSEDHGMMIRALTAFYAG